jgi:hypothetical protein
VTRAAGLAELSREAAREAARDELSRPEYAEARPPLLLRVVGRALRALAELIDTAAGAVPGGRAGLLLLLALLALFAAVVLARLRPARSRAAPRPAVFEGGEVLAARAHRERAEQAAAQVRWAEAVRERLRAVARDLEDRGALDRRPGRTAGEVARDGGAALPAVAPDLARAAEVFDEIWYGGRPADAGSYAVLVAVDERVAAERLALR